MSAVAQSIESSVDNTDVTKISANARIDYILRFSRQAILVVDEQTERYSQVGSQYLANLSANQNAAFVSVSAKLNDIQIRCRIVEQLFANSLFDPEQSLAVSIFNLAQQNSEAISIVVEHAHLLSLQLVHELSQLAEIAKKSKLNINVVLLVNLQAGALVSNHKSLFENKLTLLFAQNGQLISLSSKLFKAPSSLLQLTPIRKFILGFTLLTAILAMVLLVLYQRDTLGFSLLNTADDMMFAAEQAKVLVKSLEQGKQATFAPTKAQPEKMDSIASSREIFSLLTNATPLDIAETTHGEAFEAGPATPADIAEAIAAFSDPENQNSTVAQPTLLNLNTAGKDVFDLPAGISVNEKESQMEMNKIDSGYYQALTAGFVIQYAGFRKQSVFNAFASEFPGLTYMAYRKQLAEQELVIVTSIAFTSRAEAEEKLASLPETLLARGPWIKSIVAVNNEINAYQSSH